VHSHVFEHIYDPISFLNTVRNKITDNTIHFFSVPNLKKYLEYKYTNALCFEHSLFVSEEIIDHMLKNVGFEIIEKHYYLDHSIFYSCKKTEPVSVQYPTYLYTQNKNLFLDFLEFYQRKIDYLNLHISKFNGKVFIFGAHIFSQFMLFNGLKTEKVQSILDNSKMKIDKRLYGTKFLVQHPSVLANETDFAVIVNAGAYTTEIKNDILKNVNNKAVFL